MESWETESLRWLHRLREDNYNRTKDKPLKKVMAESRKSVLQISEALGLKVMEETGKTYSG
jgi:hypothetical protein